MTDPDRPRPMRLTYVSPGCVGFLGAALSGVFGAIGMVVEIVLSADARGPERAFEDMAELMCPVPLLSAVGGFLLALVGAWVFNALAQSVGGLPVRLAGPEQGGRSDEEAGEPMSDDPLAPRKGTSEKKPCPECGEPLRADRTFCPECGYDFDTSGP